MIMPYIAFQGQCKEALEFYGKVFGAQVKMTQPYGDYVPDGLPDPPANLAQWIVHAEMEICGTTVWFADETEPVSGGNKIKLTATVPTKEDAQKIFEQFQESSRIVLPPTETFYSTFHAEIFDKYGIGWEIVAEEAPVLQEEKRI